MEGILSDTRGVKISKCLFLVVGFEVLIIMLSLGYYGYTLEALQTITRFSGRFSLFLFSAIFLLENNPERIRNWLSEYYFLAFAVAHGIHLIELLSYLWAAKILLVPYRLAGGILAYTFIFIMPVIYAFHKRGRISSRSLGVANQIYLYYVWFIFIMTYVPRVMGKVPNAGGTFAEHLLFLIFVVMMMVLRVLVILQKRKLTS